MASQNESPRKLIRLTSIVKSEKGYNLKENMGVLMFETPPQQRNQIKEEFVVVNDESMDSPSQFILMQP